MKVPLDHESPPGRSHYRWWRYEPTSWKVIVEIILRSAALLAVIYLIDPTGWRPGWGYLIAALLVFVLMTLVEIFIRFILRR